MGCEAQADAAHGRKAKTVIIWTTWFADWGPAADEANPFHNSCRPGLHWLCRGGLQAPWRGPGNHQEKPVDSSYMVWTRFYPAAGERGMEARAIDGVRQRQTAGGAVFR